MARYPDAKWLPLDENNTQPKIVATQLIFHSAVSKSSSLFSFFQKKSVVVESHFYVQKLGGVEQYIDTDHQADANFEANPRALSAESWDDGDPDNVPWTSEQLQTLAELAVWAHKTHGIPLRRARSWTDPGIGGHTDFYQWSNVPGKTCPGRIRKTQIDTIISMANDIINGTPTSSEGELTMDKAATEAFGKVQKSLDAISAPRRPDKVDVDSGHLSLADLYTQQETFQQSVNDRLAKLEALLTSRTG